MLLRTADAAIGFAVGASMLSDAPRDAELLYGLVVGLAVGIAFSISGAYIHTLRKPLSFHHYSVGFAVAAATLMTVGTVLTLGTSTSVGRIALQMAILGLALLGSRAALILFHRSVLHRKSLWVIGDDESSARTLAAKVADQFTWYTVRRVSGPPSLKELASGLSHVEAVLCTCSLRTTVGQECYRARKELLLVPDSSEVLLSSSVAHQLDDLVVLSLPSLHLGMMARLLKRALDLLGSAALLTMAAPIMVCLYLLIPLESEGGAIFRQERRGKGGPFHLLKFRTMVADAEAHSGPVLASREDPRITRLGRLLRATRLDELPQLFNILRGEMSLVGPRPEREFFARQFEERFPEYRLRTLVKPGLTGLAQVWGRYSTSAEDKLRLDLMYIANYSFQLDLNLLLHTLRVVFHKEQSAGLESTADPRLAFGSRIAEFQFESKQGSSNSSGSVRFRKHWGGPVASNQARGIRKQEERV